MEKSKFTSKRPVEDEDTHPSTSSSLKRHMAARPRSMKNTATSVKKDPSGMNETTVLPRFALQMALRSVL
jgi:hypothetical protein